MYIKLYADVMILYNIAMIFIILTITDIFSRKKTPIKNKIFLSLIFSVAFLLSYVFNINFAIEESYIFVVILTILYSIPCDIFTLLKNYIVISISNCIVYGLISYLINKMGNLSMIAVIILSGVLIIILRNILNYKMKKYYSLTIYNNSTKAKLIALLDSGNLLEDYVTGKPVIIAEKESILNIIPKNLRQLSYKSLGNENGTLNIFMAKEARINNHIIKYPIIAIYNTNLSNSGNYNAIIGLKHLGGK
ncbi:MAG: sigma-E processing peptidase SpoIIGA [Lachnospirales bacterium]